VPTGLIICLAVPVVVPRWTGWISTSGRSCPTRCSGSRRSDARPPGAVNIFRGSKVWAGSCAASWPGLADLIGEAAWPPGGTTRL